MATSLLSYFGTIVGAGNDRKDLVNTIRTCTELSGLANDSKLEIWVQRAVARLSIYELDPNKHDGFEINMIIAIQKMTENLWHGFQEASIVQANSPFRSEKIGSYSYTRFDPRGISSGEEAEEELPVLVRVLIDAYLAEPDLVFSTTRVFQEIDSDRDNVREYYDVLDRVGSISELEMFRVI